MRTRSKLLNPVVSQADVFRFRAGSYSVRYGTTTWNAWYPRTEMLTARYNQNFKSFTDQVNPGYYRAKREGTLLPVSPMSSRKEEYLDLPGSVDAVASSETTTSRYHLNIEGMYRGSLTWPTMPSTPEVNGQVLLQEALSRAQTDAFDSLTFAAEFNKTVETIIGLRSRANNLFERYSRIMLRRKAQARDAHELAQIASEVWLELRYAWRPLYYSMLDAQEVVRRLGEDLEHPLHRAYASDSANAVAAGSYTDSFRAMGATGSWSHSYFRCRSDKTVTVEVSKHASVGLTVKTRNIHMMDPLVTAWELVPYSFVLDWFITIGDALRAFSPFASGKVEYSTLTTTKVTTLRSVAYPVLAGDFFFEKKVIQPATEMQTITEVSRELVAVTPTLALNVNLNVAKVADLVALWLVGNKHYLRRILRP